MKPSLGSAFTALAFGALAVFTVVVQARDYSYVPNNGAITVATAEPFLIYRAVSAR